MQPSVTVDKQDSVISLKATLKRILIQGLFASGIPGLPKIADFPLDDLTHNPEIYYASAIAPMIGAKQARDAVTLAHQFAKCLQSYFSAYPNAEQEIAAIAPHLEIQVGRHGWLTLMVPDLAVSAWLDILKTRPLPGLREQFSGKFDAATPSGLQLTLCDRLQLSLPLLLQWAYARCWAWLDVPQWSCAPSPPSYRAAIVATHPRPQWHSNSPVSCRVLLKTVIRAVDAIADHPPDQKVLMQQGYAVSTAVYAFDAAIAPITVKTLPPTAQSTVLSTLEATQKILSWIIAEAYGEIACKQL